MDNEIEQAQDTLQAIAQAEAAARRHGLNNGTVPLVWGTFILVWMVGFELVSGFFPLPGLGQTAAKVLLCMAPLVPALWQLRYQRQLPVRPLKCEKPLLFGLWGIYHGAVLMGGLALGTHFWQRDTALPGTWTLIGLVDAAPLLRVGWNQRRRTEAGRR